MQRSSLTLPAGFQLTSVIPAQAGIPLWPCHVRRECKPACAGMTERVQWYANRFEQFLGTCLGSFYYEAPLSNRNSGLQIRTP
jgi:hypothetical protein